MKCKLCDKVSLKNNVYCKEHYIETKLEEYLDNTDINNLGIIKWGRYFLSNLMTDKSSQKHYELLMEILSLYDPVYTNRLERQLNIVAYREFAKSFIAGMLLISYLLCNNGRIMKIRTKSGEIKKVKIDETLIVYASKTGLMAENFIVRIRDNIKYSKKILYFYKSKIEDINISEGGQWTRRAYKFNGCYVISVGVEQHIRGVVKDTRPTLIVCDDIYDEDNVVTINSRIKVKQWFDKAVANTLDTKKGKLITIGTIVHENTIIVENQQSSMWKNFYIPIMNLQQFETVVKNYLKVDYNNGIVKLPYDDLPDNEKVRKQREFFSDLEEKLKLDITWKERHNLYYIILLFKSSVEKRNLTAIYQEYFHQLISETDMRIKPEYIQVIDMKVEFVGNQPILVSPIHNKMAMDIYIGLDFATGSLSGDDSAIVVSGILSNQEIVILKTINGKYKERDDRDYNNDFGRIELDRGKIRVIGIMDEAIRLALEYKARYINVGYSGTELTRVDTLRQLVYSNKLYTIQVIGRKQTEAEGVKIERILNRLAPLYQAHRVYHNIGLEILETQLKYLVSAKNDDLADALEVSLFNMIAPPEINISHTNQNDKKNKKIGYFNKYIKRGLLNYNTNNKDWRI